MKKEIAKKLLKVYLIEIGFFIVILITAWLSAAVQYIRRTLIREEYIFLFPDYVYRYNFVSYFTGMAAFFAIFLFLYKKIMRENTAQIAGHHIVFKVIYWMIAVFFSIIMFIGICVLTFNDVYEPECLAFITYVGWPVFTALFTGIVLIRKSNTQMKADKDLSDNEVQ